MKNLNFKSLKALSLTLLVGVLSSCMNSNYGKSISREETSPLNNQNEMSSELSNSYVEIQNYLSDSVALANARSLSQSDSSLDFLNEVTWADFLIERNVLKLKIQNKEGVDLSIPKSLLEGARFRDTADLILIRLASSEISTTLIVDKNTKHVFLTKDTNIKEIELGTATSGTLQINGTHEAVLNVMATLEGSSNFVILGLRVKNLKLLAHKQ